jgi:FkbM family methyltransferase
MLIPFSQCNQIIKACHGVGVKKILHVGAHTGEEALPYSAEAVEKVIWFEANLDLLPALDQYIGKFDMQHTIIPYALWDKNETLNFNITNNRQSSSFFDLQTHATHYPEIVVNEKKKIEAYRLDTLIDRESSFMPFADFDFVNIDTQGAELAVLKGMGKHVRRPSIKGIYVEVNAEPLYKGIPLVPEIDDFLYESDFVRVVTRWTKAGWGDAFYLKARSENH